MVQLLFAAAIPAEYTPENTMIVLLSSFISHFSLQNITQSDPDQLLPHTDLEMPNRNAKGKDYPHDSLSKLLRAVNFVLLMLQESLSLP